MKSFEFTFRNLNSGELDLEKALYNANLSDRKGYDKCFLNKELPIPLLKQDSLNSEIAENQIPGANGKLFLDYTHFSVMFNKVKKLPIYTAVNIEGQTNTIAREHEQRSSDSWFKDKRIPLTVQYGDEDYSGSGFQKGHMVRFYDPAWGNDDTTKKIAIGDTFHYTNCCPQLGKYNAGVWNDLEDYYMACSIFQDRKITVFTGPIFNKAKEINGLLVPVNFWKIIVYNKLDSIEALGFIISQELSYNKMVEEKLLVEKKIVKPTLDKSDIDRLFNKKDLKQWVVKIALIEEKTGINFGLNSFDKNNAEGRHFYKNAIEEDGKIQKMKHLIDYKSFEKSYMEDDFVQFIKDI